MTSKFPPLREVVRHYNLRADKSLGQNFLFDRNLMDKIVRNSEKLDGRNVVEIGPGPGGLTQALLESKAKHIVALEYDQRCIKALQDYLVPLAEGRLELIETDALAFDYSALVGRLGVLHVVANLPYNIATPLLIGWLKNLHWFSGFTLMFQKEVAERICADSGSKVYGRLSVMAQAFCDVSMVFNIPPRAFIPSPKVFSSVVSLVPRAKPVEEITFEVLEPFCKLLFSQRRKTLRAILKQRKSIDLSVLESKGFDLSKRPEALDVASICKMAKEVNL